MRLGQYLLRAPDIRKGSTMAKRLFWALVGALSLALLQSACGSSCEWGWREAENLCGYLDASPGDGDQDFSSFEAQQCDEKCPDVDRCLVFPPIDDAGVQKYRLSCADYICSQEL